MEFINPIFEFSRAMRRLGLDDAEYALLIAINIFSADRPNVQEPSRVEALQQPYVEALLSYTRIKRPQVQEPTPPRALAGTGGPGPTWGPPRAEVLLPHQSWALSAAPTARLLWQRPEPWPVSSWPSLSSGLCPVTKEPGPVQA